ncbi:MAG TPA: S1/P1 nuclease, partial [Pedobacter sp.]
MKVRYLLSVSVVLFSFVLMSWGVTGHRAIAKIAENHLTPKAKTAVYELLGAENLSDVSTWADEVRRNHEYKYTTPWHYIDLPLGLTYAHFKDKAESMTDDNVYSSLLKQEQILKDNNAPRDKMIEAV